MNRKQRKYMEFMASDDWETIRKAKLRRSGRECERCHTKENLQVHHLNYDDELGKISYADLMVLCSKCHNLTHQDLECFEKK